MIMMTTWFRVGRKTSISINRYLVIFSLLFSFGCQDNTDNETEKQASMSIKTVAWYQLSEKNNQPTRILSGQINAAEGSQLSFEASGKISQIHVGLGQSFHKGQPLADLDKTQYQLQLQQAKAQLTAAIAAKNQAQKEVNRRQKLVKANAISTSQFEQFRLQLLSTTENVKAAQATAKLAAKQLADTTLVAPFDGIVNAKLAEIGQLVSPRVPIFRIETQTPPKVHVSLAENLIDTLHLGQAVTVTVPALSSTTAFAATVSEISSQATLGAFPITIIFDKPSNQLKAGMTAEIHLVTDTTHAQGTFAIPTSALGADNNQQYYVYAIRQSNNQQQLEKVQVTILSLSEKSILINSPLLQTDDYIVRSGLGFLIPKQSVRLMGQGPRSVNL